MSDTPLYLGIDAGGSRCKARLADTGGRVLAEVESGPANARIGVDRLRESFTHIAEAAMDAAGLDPAHLPDVTAGIGVAGLSRPGMRTAIEALDFPFRCRALETDAAIACLGAHGGLDGAILILGTGSVAHIRDGQRSVTIGGYGFPISDEGSGAALGLSAVRHALRALDGRTRSTPLSAAVSRRFGDDTSQAVAWMDSATPYDYGTFAPLVLDFAEKNDEIARSIVESAAEHVERFIETIFEKGAARCALVGGVSQRMMPWLRERTTNRLVAARGDALDGALLLAGLDPNPRG